MDPVLCQLGIHLGCADGGSPSGSSSNGRLAGCGTVTSAGPVTGTCSSAMAVMLVCSECAMMRGAGTSAASSPTDGSAGLEGALPRPEYLPALICCLSCWPRLKYPTGSSDNVDYDGLC